MIGIWPVVVGLRVWAIILEVEIVMCGLAVAGCLWSLGWNFKMASFRQAQEGALEMAEQLNCHDDWHTLRAGANACQCGLIRGVLEQDGDMISIRFPDGEATGVILPSPSIVDSMSVRIDRLTPEEP